MKVVIATALCVLGVASPAWAQHTPWEPLYAGDGVAMHGVHIKRVQVEKHRRVTVKPTRNVTVTHGRAKAHIIARPRKASVTNRGHGLVYARIVFSR